MKEGKGKEADDRAVAIEKSYLCFWDIDESVRVMQQSSLDAPAAEKNLQWPPESYLRCEIFRSSTEGFHGGVRSNSLLTKTKICDFDVAVFVQHQILQLQQNQIKYSSNLNPMIINMIHRVETGFNQGNISNPLIRHFYTLTQVDNYFY